MTKADNVREFVSKHKFDTVGEAHKAWQKFSGLTMHYSQFHTVTKKTSTPLRVPKPHQRPQTVNLISTMRIVAQTVAEKDLTKYVFNWNDKLAKEKMVTDQMIAAMKFYGLDGWKFKYDKAKTRAGVCSPRGKYLGLSIHYALRNELKEIEDTILHEIAHALDYEYGYKSHHGYPWQRIAVKIGCNGERCYDSKTVDMPEPKYHYNCPKCERVIKRHKRILRREIACGKCCKRYNRGDFDRQYVLVRIK